MLRMVAAYCDHYVRGRVVESINTTLKAVLRRARGMRDKEIVLLRLKATVHPFDRLATRCDL
jgi:transposase